MEELVRAIPGVIDTTVGYTGGTVPNPTYDQVSRGTTGHTEALEVVYDPARVSYEALLEFFFRSHDPTTKNRQGNDLGSQYRSAIFYQDEAQRAAAETMKAIVDTSGRWRGNVVTEIVPAGPFYPAEDYHQDYLQHHPNGYTCHYVRPWSYTTETSRQRSDVIRSVSRGAGGSGHLARPGASHPLLLADAMPGKKHPVPNNPKVGANG